MYRVTSTVSKLVISCSAPSGQEETWCDDASERARQRVRCVLRDISRPRRRTRFHTDVRVRCMHVRVDVYTSFRKKGRERENRVRACVRAHAICTYAYVLSFLVSSYMRETEKCRVHGE